MATEHLDNLNLTGNIGLSGAAIRGENPGLIIAAGSVDYVEMSSVADDITINGQAEFSNPVTMPQVILRQDTGSNTGGKVTLDGSGNSTITTDVVASTSLIMLTYAEATGGGDVTPWYDNVSAGTSFQVHGEADRDLDWMLFNQV
jgi:hypothetical protein